MELSDFWGFAGVPFIVALVAVAKAWVSDTRWLPPLALALGVILNVGITANTGKDLLTGVLVGLAVGLASSGLYEQGRSVLGGTPASKMMTNPQGSSLRPPGPLR